MRVDDDDDDIQEYKRPWVGLTEDSNPVDVYAEILLHRQLAYES
jgi:uncharacterized protein YegL